MLNQGFGLGFVKPKEKLMQLPHLGQYTCIIIDILKAYILRMKEFTMLATYTDPIAGVEAIRKYGEIDFLFLDIGMEVSGIDIAKVIRDQVKYLIFVTAYEKYALDAFRVYCDKFLVKPVNYEQIGQAIAHLVKRDNFKGNQ
jgi:two-component system LytT family response regulator